MNLPRELYVRRPLTLLAPLAKRAEAYAEVFGGLTLVRVSGEVRDALALRLGRMLLVLSFGHRRSPLLPSSAVKETRRAVTTGSRETLSLFTKCSRRSARSTLS